MPKITVDTRTDLALKATKAGVCDIKTNVDFKGWNSEIIAQPQTGSKDGIAGGITGCNVDVVFNNKNFFVYLDNIDLIPAGKWAPRVTYKRKVELASKKYDCEATYAMAGNTSFLPEREELSSDIMRLSVKAPAMGGVTPKLEYGTLNNVGICTLSGKVDKLDLALKTEAHMPTQKNGNKFSTKAELKATYPLPQGFKMVATMKNPLKGSKVELSKGRYTLECPIKSLSAIPSAADAKIKVKYATDIEV